MIYPQPDEHICKQFVLVARGAPLAASFLQSFSAALISYGVRVTVNTALYSITGEFMAPAPEPSAPRDDGVVGDRSQVTSSTPASPAVGSGRDSVTDCDSVGAASSAACTLREDVVESALPPPVPKPESVSVSAAAVEPVVLFGLRVQLLMLPDKAFQLDCVCTSGSVADFSRCMSAVRDVVRPLCRGEVTLRKA